MIFRKPYAFLIRNFRKINIILFLITVFAFAKELQLANLTKEYIEYGDAIILKNILTIFSSTYYLSLIAILIITGILLFLLYKKDKPIKVYSLIMITYLANLIFIIYANSYFSQIIVHGFDKAMARNMNGFAFIISLPQYAILLLLLIRSIGLDLNSFGFRQDKELLASEEDREEVEVEVEFNKDKLKRKWNYYIRNGKYFIKQNKVYCIIATIFILLFGGLFTYRQIYIVNKVYKQQETLSGNYYKFKVNHSYITTKDFKGDTLENGKSYIIIDFDVTNQLDYERTLDIDKFMIMIDDKMYTPTVNYNEYFSDLGPVFKKQPLGAKTKENYFIIYEIDTPKQDASIFLRYQDLAHSAKLIKIRLQIKDITAFVERETKTSGEVLTIPVNVEETKELEVTSYEIGKSYNYTYESCYINTCPIYQATASAETGRNILYLKINPRNSTTKEILEFMLRYGKIKYKIGETEYQESITSAISKAYKGNFILLSIPEHIEEKSISFVFTIRNNQYTYKLK